MNKVITIALMLLCAPFSYAKSSDELNQSSCQTGPIYERFGDAKRQAGLLRFDGRTNARLSRSQLVQYRFVTVLHEYLGTLCHQENAYDANSLGALLLTKENIVMSHVGTVHFASGSALVDEATLARCCSHISQTSDYDGIFIVSRTDSIGNASHNRALSYQRGYRIAERLPQASPIHLIALGARPARSGQRPIANPNDRRADIYLYQHQ